jgi:hypothetical protein
MTLQVYNVTCPSSLKRKNYRSLRAGLHCLLAVPKSKLISEVLEIGHAAMKMVAPNGPLEWNMSKAIYGRRLLLSEATDVVGGRRIAVLEAVGCSVRAEIHGIPESGSPSETEGVPTTKNSVTRATKKTKKKTETKPMKEYRAPPRPKSKPAPAPASKFKPAPAPSPKSPPTPAPSSKSKPAPAPSSKPKPAPAPSPKSTPRSSVPSPKGIVERIVLLKSSRGAGRKLAFGEEHSKRQNVHAQSSTTDPGFVPESPEKRQTSRTVAMANKKTRGSKDSVAETPEKSSNGDFTEGTRDTSPPPKRRRLATQQSLDACHLWTTTMEAMGFPCDSFFRDKFFEWAADDGNEDNSRITRMFVATETLAEAMYNASAAQEEAVVVSKGLRTMY